MSAEKVKEIQRMLLQMISDDALLEEVFSMVEWKSNVDNDIQIEADKINDLYYFMKGLLVGKKLSGAKKN